MCIFGNSTPRGVCAAWHMRFCADVRWYASSEFVCPHVPAAHVSQSVHASKLWPSHTHPSAAPAPSPSSPTPLAVLPRPRPCPRGSTSACTGATMPEPAAQDKKQDTRPCPWGSASGRTHVPPRTNGWTCARHGRTRVLQCRSLQHTACAPMCWCWCWCCCTYLSSAVSIA